MLVDADYNDASSLQGYDPIFLVFELFFNGFFTFEIAVRYAAFEKKKDAFQDKWFVMDLWLVVIGYVEIGGRPS